MITKNVNPNEFIDLFQNNSDLQIQFVPNQELAQIRTLMLETFLGIHTVSTVLN